MSASFEFDVSEPQKKETNKALDMGYWTYKITARTNLSQYRNMALVTMRRYSDFDWLRHQLVLTYPGIIVPPIPEKELSGQLQKLSSTSDNNSPLLQYRQRNLRRFLMRVGAHAVLGPSRLLQEFLELNDVEWAARMKNGKKKDDVALTKRISQKIFATNLPIEEPLADKTVIDGLTHYVQQLEAVMTMFKEKLVIYAHRRREATFTSRDMGRVMVNLAEYTDMFNDPSLVKSLQEVGSASVNISQVGVNQSDLELTQLAESVHYYIGICSAMQEVIDLLASEKKELRYLAGQIVEAEVNKQKAQEANNTPTVVKCESQIETFTPQRDAKRRDIQKLEAELMSEVNRVHQEKLYDFQQLLRCFSDIQVEYADKVTRSWESLLPMIRGSAGGEVETSAPTATSTTTRHEEHHVESNVPTTSAPQDVDDNEEQF